VHGGVRGSRVRVVGWDGVVGAAGGGGGAEGGGCCGCWAVGGGAEGAEGGSLEHCCGLPGCSMVGVASGVEVELRESLVSTGSAELRLGTRLQLRKVKLGYVKSRVHLLYKLAQTPSRAVPPRRKSTH